MTFYISAARRLMPDIRTLKYRLRRWTWYRAAHLAYTAWRARHSGLPAWRKLLRKDASTWASARDKAAGNRERVLVATGTAGHLPSMTVESLLGVALTLRDCAVDFLLCDRALPACMMCEINWYSDVEAFAASGPSDRCRACYEPSAAMLDQTGFNHVGLGTQLTADECLQARSLTTTTPYRSIASFSIDGIPIGEHAMAGALRFYARGDIEMEEEGEAVLRRYFEAALLTYYACRRLLSGGDYKTVVLNHGIYVPQGVIAETARRLGVRVVTWHPAYRRGCFIFNHDETYHHGLLSEPTSSWEQMAWSERHRERIQSYLYSRWVGNRDWVRFHNAPEFDVKAIAVETGIDLERPTIGLLTNVVWDAQLHYRANAFPGMLDWLIKTVEYFVKRSDLQLLIRVHPAEISGTVPSNQRVVDELRRAFPQLPRNVFVIPPESHLSTYVAMSHCNAVIIYGTKTGVELSATGKPVIVAGEAWIRGKGVTLDAESEADYFKLLDALPLSTEMDDMTKERALRYAYHFFFRRMIPLECFKSRKGWPPFGVDIDVLADLAPGSSKGLDLVCQGILTGSPFIYPDEQMVNTNEL